MKNIKYIGAAVQISFQFATFHLREVSQICDVSFTRGKPPISVTGHWRILSYAYTLYALWTNFIFYVNIIAPETGKIFQRKAL